MEPTKISRLRFRYNQAFLSVNAMVPGVFMLMLCLIPAIMSAIAVVREKETGSIANFRSTPITRFEFLLGKQLPYVVVAMANFFVLLLMAMFVFNVPVKGPFLLLLIGTFVYVIGDDRLRGADLVLRAHAGRRGVRDRHPFDRHRRSIFPACSRPCRRCPAERRSWACPSRPPGISRSSSACSPRRWAYRSYGPHLLAIAVIALAFLALSLLLLAQAGGLNMSATSGNSVARLPGNIRR